MEGEETGVRVENKTSDGLKFQVYRTRSNAYVFIDEQDALRVMPEFGSFDPDFVIPLIRQIAKLGIKGNNFDSEVIKFALSFVRGIRPRDQIGALLGAHMVAVHLELLFNVSRVNQAQFVQYNEEEEKADRAVSRLTRTFMALAEHLTGTRMVGNRSLRYDIRRSLKMAGQPQIVQAQIVPCSYPRPQDGENAGLNTSE
jgi:hypothetical protein